MKTHVLILTSDLGFGHRSAANAVAETIKILCPADCQVTISNPLNDRRVPAFLRRNQSDYDRIVREMPELQRVSYQISDTSTPAIVLEAFFTVIFYPVLYDLLTKLKPDLVICTSQLYIAPMVNFVSLQRSQVAIFSVITDLTRLHRSWFHEGVDMTLVPTEEAFGEALSYNIPKEKIVVSGVPVRPGFQLDTRSKQKLRMELGWNTSMTTALVVGSKRVKNMENILHALNHSGWPIQWVLVAGKDEKLASWFRAQEWHNPVFIYDYIDQMHQFMGAADFVITKAGGLVVSESLASGLPMLIVDVTPGQEEGNVEYVISHQAGDLAPTPLQAVETLAHWMKHGQAVLLRRSHAARLAGRANSAFVVAELALTMIAQQSAQQKTMKISRQRSMPPRLKLLLENLGIRPEIKQPGKITPHGEK